MCCALYKRNNEVDWTELTSIRPGASAQMSAILSGTHERTGFFQARANILKIAIKRVEERTTIYK